MYLPAPSNLSKPSCCVAAIVRLILVNDSVRQVEQSYSAISQSEAPKSLTFSVTDRDRRSNQAIHFRDDRA